MNPTPGILNVIRVALDRADMSYRATGFKPFEIEAAKAWVKAAPTPPAQAADSVLEDAALPDRTGIYKWQSGTSVALVLVDKRPSAHSPGGQFNGHVIESTKFYDGCPVSSWGQDGKWTLLHDFDAARKQGGA